MALEELHDRSPAPHPSNRSFGVTFAAVFALIGLWPLLYREVPRAWALVIGAGFLLAALLKPRWLGGLNVIWARFGLLLHRVVSPVVLGLVFYLAVVPMGALLRLFGKDPLRLKFEPKAASYWIERVPPGPDPTTMKHPF